jgi:hypothetical protein
MAILNDDSNGKSPFQHPFHLSFTLLTLTSSTIILLFLGRLYDMTTDIGSLASGLDELVIRLGIGRKRLIVVKCAPIPL